MTGFRALKRVWFVGGSSIFMDGEPWKLRRFQKEFEMTSGTVYMPSHPDNPNS